MTPLRCHEWDIHQSYRRDRAAPPWIKVHRNLMQSSKWARLTDSEKGQLVSIWLLAADRDGEVPADPFLLRKICMLDAEPNLEKFMELGLLTSVERQLDVKVTPTRRQHDAPEAEEISDTDKKEQDAPRKRVASKGTRLPDNWKPDEGLMAWAMKERPGMDIQRTLDSFTDYWRAKPGAGGRKIDWNATFRNWVRNENTAANSNRTGKQAIRSERPNLSQRAHAAADWALKHGDF